MRNFKVEAIVLSYKNFSEADRFLTIFTKEQGKLSVLAKGVRRVPSRRAPHLEPFNYVNVFLHETSSGNLIVSQAEVIEAFENLKKDIKKVGLAFYAVELVSRLTKENQEHGEVFDRLLIFLQNLNSRELPLFQSVIPAQAGIYSYPAPDADSAHVDPRFPSNSAGRRGDDGRFVYEAIIQDFQQDILKFLGFGTEKLAQERDLRYYIEELLENKLKTPEFLEKLSLNNP